MLVKAKNKLDQKKSKLIKSKKFTLEEVLSEKNKLIDEIVLDYLNQEKSYKNNQQILLNNIFKSKHQDNRIEVCVSNNISSEIAFNHLFVKGKEKLSKSVLIPSNNHLSNNNNLNKKSFVGVQNLQHHSTLSLGNNYSSKNVNLRSNNIENENKVKEGNNRNLSQYSKIINNLENQLINQNKLNNIENNQITTKVADYSKESSTKKSNEETKNYNGIPQKSKNPSGKFMAPLAEINLTSNLNTNNNNTLKENKNVEHLLSTKKNNYTVLVNSNRSSNPPNALVESHEVKEDPNKVKNINKFLTKNTHNTASINNNNLSNIPNNINPSNNSNVFSISNSSNLNTSQTNNRYLSLSNKPALKKKLFKQIQ